jgi:putative hydrolase of the HAD superfamily
MSEIKVLFFDVGGVLLSNGWDTASRRRAGEKFGLDWDEYQERHYLVSRNFETGKLTLLEYLQRTVFYRERDFTEIDFIEFMKSRSVAKPESLAIAQTLSGSGRYLMATLNNESRELNDYRIEAFGLREYFSVFLTSSYLGVAKPDERIYRIAVDVTGYRPDQCVFVDDRKINLECADLAGIHPIHFTNAEALRASLRDLGVAT